jgi:tRNA(Ile)-lysidine synthase
MSLLRRFEENIKAQGLFSTKDKLLLAVSGGVDSVVLCELCRQAGYDFEITHCNFKLREKESERDEAFVRALVKKYNVQFFIKEFDTTGYASKKKISIQEAARELRYEWFGELVRLPTPDSRLPTPDFLLTAHHADDNAETVLMNFCRGTGLHGLTGIPVAAGYIRRPLLCFSKEELILFAKENHLDFVEDSSNQSSKYTRNLFRNEIIPAISGVYPQVKENLQDNINRFKEIEKLYQLSVREIKNKICKQKGNELHIPVKQLMGYKNKALIYEIISDYGFSEKQLDEVIKLAGSESGRYIQSPAGDYRIIRHRHWFIISPVAAIEAENIIIEEGVRNLEFGMGQLTFEVVTNSKSQTLPGKQVPNSPHTGILDLKEIRFPLLLRKWKAGDYFYPLGMKKKKKLARFFIDQKMSKAGKEKVWVLEMNKKIIWVVGHRIDDRFKITDHTTSLLKISVSGLLQTG